MQNISQKYTKTVNILDTPTTFNENIAVFFIQLSSLYKQLHEKRQNAPDTPSRELYLFRWPGALLPGHQLDSGYQGVRLEPLFFSPSRGVTPWSAWSPLAESEDLPR